MPTLQVQEQAQAVETAAEAGHRMGYDKRYLLRRARQAYDGGLNGLVKALVVTSRQDTRGQLRAWRWQAPPGVWDRIRRLPIPRGQEQPETLARGAELLVPDQQRTHQSVRWGRATMWLKGCPKCGGDLIRSRWRADDVACLQCGRELRSAELAALEG